MRIKRKTRGVKKLAFSLLKERLAYLVIKARLGGSRHAPINNTTFSCLIMLSKETYDTSKKQITDNNDNDNYDNDNDDYNNDGDDDTGHIITH